MILVWLKAQECAARFAWLKAECKRLSAVLQGLCVTNGLGLKADSFVARSSLGSMLALRANSYNADLPIMK